MDELKELLELLNEHNVLTYKGSASGEGVVELEFATDDDEQKQPGLEEPFEVDYSALEWTELDGTEPN